MIEDYLTIELHLISIPFEVRKLILGPSPATKAQLLSFNRAQSRVVTGLLTRHNALCPEKTSVYNGVE